MPLPKPARARTNSGKRVAQQHALSRTSTAARPAKGRAQTTLCIDIDGTGIKMIALDGKGEPVTERLRQLTPHPARPTAVLEVIRNSSGNAQRKPRLPNATGAGQGNEPARTGQNQIANRRNLALAAE